MTMFTNGYSSLQIPEDFEPVATKEEFNDLYLVNTKIPMSIKFSTTPTLVGLPEIMDGIEQNLKNNDKIEVVNSDFITINDQIYYMIVSSFSDGENEIRRNEFLYVEDSNLYIFEFTYPYADRELDDFYLNIIRSLKISVPKYIVEDGNYIISSPFLSTYSALPILILILSLLGLLLISPTLGCASSGSGDFLLLKTLRVFSFLNLCSSVS